MAASLGKGFWECSPACDSEDWATATVWERHVNSAGQIALVCPGDHCRIPRTRLDICIVGGVTQRWSQAVSLGEASAILTGAMFPEVGTELGVL